MEVLRQKFLGVYCFMSVYKIEVCFCVPRGKESIKIDYGLCV
jgi:hypothetical protein